MINIIFNYIYLDLKWTLESKSEYIVENNIYHLVIFQNGFASANIIYNQREAYDLTKICGGIKQ